jgi:hypothetical protein
VSPRRHWRVPLPRTNTCVVLREWDRLPAGHGFPKRFRGMDRLEAYPVSSSSRSLRSDWRSRWLSFVSRIK